MQQYLSTVHTNNSSIIFAIHPIAKLFTMNTLNNQLHMIRK